MTDNRATSVADRREEQRPIKSAPVTIQRLDHAIAVTAYVMQRHNLPQLLPTLKRLEAARSDLLRDGDPLEYARRVLERSAIDVQQQRRLAA